MKNKSAIIRRFHVKDLDRILEIERESFIDPWRKELFKNINSEPNPHFLLAEKHGQVVGYIIISSNNLKSTGRILNLAVKKRHRKQGIGSILIQKSIETFKNNNISTIYLEVRQSNLAATRLYIKLGFIKNGTVKGYYQDGETAYLMSRRITNINPRLKK